MPVTRIYQRVALHVGQQLMLTSAASHHLAQVLRAKVADKLIIFNGEGGEYAAHISKLDKKNVCVQLEAFVPREAESPLDICLAQGIARGEKMDMIIQKAVELGVTTIQPLLTARCNVQLSGERMSKRLLHWQSIVAGACEQCGRNRVPAILAPEGLSAWLQHKAGVERQQFILLPEAERSTTLKQLALNATGAKVTVLIGPEGGFSPEEIALSLAQGFKPLSLGPRILRTETAPLAIVAALQACYGDG